MGFTNAISSYRVPFSKNPWLLTFAGCFGVLWISTLIWTPDLANWFLENALVVVGLIGLAIGYRYLQLSDLSYLLIPVYLSLHVYGAMYTYAGNPFGAWLQSTFDLQRNPYDRIVHFSFGFLLAYPMRELFLIGLKWPPWVAWLLPIELTLSFSALYELLEWGVADIFFTEQGPTFLGTQGDVWDAQKDIFAAFLGAVIATTIVSYLKKRLRIQ